MSPWLFNIYMDGVRREFKEKTSNCGAKLGKDNEKWRLNHILFADDVVLVGDNGEELQEMVEIFEETCRRRKLKMNVKK